jgi:hypothetical protein
MAGDRVERVLQTLFVCQKEAQPTENVSSFRRRVLAHTQDFDGEVEGPFLVNLLNPYR